MALEQKLYTLQQIIRQAQDYIADQANEGLISPEEADELSGLVNSRLLDTEATPARMGDVWYDHDLKLWTFFLLDARGNQITEAQYAKRRVDIEDIAHQDCFAAGVSTYTITTTKGQCLPVRVKEAR